MPSSAEYLDAEKQVKRNPHPDFKKVEASRPDWSTQDWEFTKTKKPEWKIGDGANDNGASLTKNHVEIDPYEAGRPAVSNYKLLISAIVPRPVGFISTISKDGTSTNLAPFSYFQVFAHDPPMFTIGFASAMPNADPRTNVKDTLRNLVEVGECTLNIISEHFIEAANCTSINAPFGVSEFALSGLHAAPSKIVKPSRVQEAIFSVEAKLVEAKEYESRVTPGKKTATLAIVEGVRFWAREDALNEDKNLLDPSILRPIARMGGITYGRIVEAIEIPRPDYAEQMKLEGAQDFAKPKGDGQ